MGSDLCKGFDTFRQLDDTKDDHLDSLLKAIMHIEKTSDERCEADFVTWRGMMTKVETQSSMKLAKTLQIMATPGDWMLGSGQVCQSDVKHKTDSSRFEMNATFFQV